MDCKQRRLRICVVTGSRAEYGLFYWLLKGFEEDDYFDLKLVVTGSHLSPEFGNTFHQIEEDGFRIDKKVEMLLAGDTSGNICKSVGLSFFGMSESYKELKPDVVLVLGDRYEILPVVASALFFKIPVAHMYGGELTMGAQDDNIRHAITKLSHLHFTANEEYRTRVIQLGENPELVFNVGSMGIENVRRTKLLSREELEKELDVNFSKKRNILVTYHPVTLEDNTEKKQFNNLIDVLNEINDSFIIFTKANADLGGKNINMLIDQYVNKNPEKSCAFTSLGRVNYLSCLNIVDAVVGNSSSGLIEAPCFNVGTINIGDRQKGRIRPKSVIDSDSDKDSIRRALKKVFSEEFRLKLKKISHPYGDGRTSEKILKILKEVEVKKLLKKKFYDLEISSTSFKN